MPEMTTPALPPVAPARLPPVHTILLRLRQPGAHLTFVDVPPGTIKLVEPARRANPAGVLLPALLFDRIFAAGWLVVDDCNGSKRLRLSPSAEQQLRKLKSNRAKRRLAVKRAPAQRPSQATTATRGRPSPLASYARRRDRDGQPIISSIQCDAGERLAADFMRGQMMPRVTASWSAPAQNARTRRTAPGAGVEMADNVAAARQRVAKALDAVGAEFAGVLLDICCFESGLEETEGRHQLPQRSAKVVLQMGLTRLARHYGLLAQPAAARELRHWGDDGFRPTLDAWRTR